MARKVAFSWTELDGRVGTLDVDAVLREGNTEVSEITENPVELSADVTDHIRDKSDTLTIEFVITNTPVEIPQTNAEGVSGAFQKNSNSGGVTLQFSGEFNRVVSVRETLSRVRRQGLKWQVFSAVKTYSDFLLEQIQFSRDQNTGDAVSFVLQLKRVRFVSTRVVSVPVRRRRVIPNQARGTQPPAPPRNSAIYNLVFGR